ncbi:MAG: fibronectin type III domain-containing protein [Ignavibacteriaceae bacterium]|jgi:hypothetical protein|nr:fibronectin type III domain-containing protein [Ignavibacteriaceae bacterium]
MKTIQRFKYALIALLFVLPTVFAQSPANLAVGVSATTNFTFAGVTTIDNERIQISTTTSFALPGTVVMNAGVGLLGTPGYTFSHFDLIGSLAGNTQFNNNTTYYWRIAQTDATTLMEPLAPPNYYTFTTILGPPAATAASAITTAGFTANWTAHVNGGAVDYRLDVSDDNFATTLAGYTNLTVAGLSQAVAGLTAGTTYKYRVRAVNVDGTSVNSNEITVVTIPAAPVASAATGTTSVAFTANWGAATGATSYRLDVSVDNFATTLAGYTDLTVAGTSQAVVGLAANTTYKYRVRAVNGGGTSGNSNEITVTTILGPPTATAATAVLTTGFTANWNASGGATSYILRVGTTSGGTNVINDFNVGNVLTHTLNGLTAGTQYFYSVKASDGINTSSASNEITVTTVPLAPVATAATGTTGVAFTANWGAAAGATSYRLDVSVDNFATTLAGYTDLTVAGTSQAVAGLTAHTTYKYRVRAVNSGGTSGNSNEITVTTIANALPGAFTLTSPTGGIILGAVTPAVFTWTASTEADDYTVQISDDNFTTINYSTTTTVPTVTATFLLLRSEADYKWRVKANNNLGTTTSSEAHFYTPAATLAPASFSLVSPATGAVTNIVGATTLVTFNWQHSTEVREYTIKVTKGAIAGADIVTPGLTFTSPSASIFLPLLLADAGSEYQWQVTATNSVGSQLSTEVFSFYTLATGGPVLSSPANTAEVTETPTLTWASVTAPPTVTYTLQVTPDPTFYTIPSGLSFVNLPSGGATTSQAIITPLARGGIYYWRVKASNAVGPVQWSSIRNFVVSASGSVTPPTPVLANPSNTETIYGLSANLAWYSTYFGNQLDYKIEYTNNTTLVVSTIPYGTLLPLGTTTYTLPGLDPSTTYSWRVISKNLAAVESAWSAPFTFTTPAPTTASVPVPSWPIGGNDIYNFPPTLYWYVNGNSSGLTYNLEYNFIDNTFTAGVTAAAGIAVSNYSLAIPPANMIPGQNVYWRVRSNNGVTLSAWASTSFKIGNTAAVPVAPVASYPINDETIYDTQTDLKWYVNGNSTGLSYRVEIGYPDVTQNTLTYSVGPNVYVKNVTPLTWATTYGWRVSSTLDGINFSSPSTEAIFSTFGVGGANIPVQSWPADGITVYTSSQKLNWYVNGPSAGYTYDVELNGTQVVTAEDSTTHFVELTAGQTYYWRVRSHSGASTSNWSPLLSFYAYSGTNSVAPLLATPTNGVSVVTTSPQLSWFINTPTSSLNYELQVSEDAVFTNPTTVSNLSSSSYQTDNLALNKTYYWRVRSKDTGGNFSNYSKAEKFAVGSLTGVENMGGKIPTEFSIDQNYPNPFNPTTIIRYGIPQNADVTLSIYNMLGQKIKTLVSEQKNAGTYSVQWNGDNEFGQKVSSGAYIYRINAGNFVKAMKLILMK